MKTSSVNGIVFFIVISGQLWGCKDKTAQQPPARQAGSGSGRETPADASVTDAAATWTGNDRANRYEQFWNAANEARFDELKSYFADAAVLEAPGLAPDIKGADAIVQDAKDVRTVFADQKGQPQLILVDGSDVVGVVLVTGTQTGPMGDIPATNKKFGIPLAYILSFDDANKIGHAWEFFDFATALGQLGHSKAAVHAVIDKPWGDKHVVVADHGETERANANALAQLTDAFNKHDAAAFGELLADDTVWSDTTLPSDLDKKQAVARSATLWKSFPNAKMTVTKSWRAGEYVAAVETFEGTNSAPAPALGVANATGRSVVVPLLAIHQLDGGKIDKTWVFFQSDGVKQQLLPPAK